MYGGKDGGREGYAGDWNRTCEKLGRIREDDANIAYSFVFFLQLLIPFVKSTGLSISQNFA